MKGLFNRSLNSREAIQMIYLAADGTISQRSVTVLTFNEVHIICYCHNRKQRRTFKIENILSVFPINKRIYA
ncbi:hypothetical protein [Bacillus solitudinis]|uniref:hypothetical protein n=1 Tax=Bacillus solitudinis TaxID=2014074 RepID=UPI000C232E33|nr:hypothetical protein [Bacillus solitudinis]